MSPLISCSPESQGISSAAILEFVNRFDREIHEPHSFMLLRHGCQVAAGWWRPYAPQHPHMLYSLSKSFTSTAVGLAAAEGLLSIDDPVRSFFPDDLPEKVGPNLQAMRVRDLLSMTSGHHEDTMHRMASVPDGNWIRGFLGLDVEHAPGTYFVYNTGASYMLSAIVQKVSGMTLLDYLTPRLLEPLGIEGAEWELSPQGIHMGGFGMSIKTEDIARFGQLLLQKGQWQGVQILPEEWVEMASARQADNGSSPISDWEQGYGFQFWRCRHNAYRGDGAFGQYCIVMPEQDAVLAITAAVDDMQIPLDIIWDVLLPAMKADALPEDPRAQDELSAQLYELALPPVSGQGTGLLEAELSGKTYKMKPNDMGLDTLRFEFAGVGCTLTLQEKSGEYRLVCGRGEWLPGEMPRMDRESPAHPRAIQPVVCSYAWTDKNLLKLVMRFYETPFYYTYTCRFTENRLSIDAAVNVAFEGKTFPRMVGVQQ